jgi:hypothetical protein
MAVIGVVVALTAINTFAGPSTMLRAGKPLKVFVIAGQSNAQGKAQVFTIERLNLTEDSKQMYQDMGVKDGIPSAVKDVYGVYYTDEKISSFGPMVPGYGDPKPDTRFGPDYTFSIYMQKHLNEPFLIIKTAWGGKDMRQAFRPPSAGPFEKDKDSGGSSAGPCYNLIIKGVKEVLADPGKYHPSYKSEDGYEIAGFVWFQGWNDYIGGYPIVSGADNGAIKDYSEYSRLMACFIRDVRKDLNAPKMPFVIGVAGFDGPIENPNNNMYLFRKAQEAPASLPEFAGNVVAVRTENCWDMELMRIINKPKEEAKKHDLEVKNKVLADNPELAGNPRALSVAVGKLAQTMTNAPTALTPEEQKILKVGQSNRGYHYLGSAYIYGNIGKVLADGMAKMVK